MALRRIVISGCSGGGKSTLIEALASRGFPVVAEAGRIIVQQELSADGAALPWISPSKFAEKLATLAIEQFGSVADLDGVVFFDRSAVEALVYSKRYNLILPVPVTQAAKGCRYDNPIFLVPPWQEIFISDTERRHSFDEAVAEYDALSKAFEEFGYKICIVPKMAIPDRVDFILGAL